jgi:CBS domain-containing protein
VPPTNAPRDNIRMKVTVRYVVTPDADARLSRAIDILLENATRKQKPPAVDSREHCIEKPCAQISNDSGSGGRN